MTDVKPVKAAPVGGAVASSGDSEVERLRAENADLRRKLAESDGEHSDSMHRVEPKFGMSEGERQEIEARGSAISPYTGELRTAADLPAGVEVEQSERARKDGEKAAERERERLARAENAK